MTRFSESAVRERVRKKKRVGKGVVYMTEPES